MFANLFTVLVGPPGVGKTRAIKFGRDLLTRIPEIVLSPDAITKEKLLDAMQAATKIVNAAEVQTQTAYACFLDELSTFIQARDTAFMTTLTALWDNPKVFNYETLARGKTHLENVFMTMIGGITPKSIFNNWGEQAFGMGFTARLNLIFSEEAAPIDLFGTTVEWTGAELLPDLKRIAGLRGRMTIDPEVQRTIQAWFNEGMPPIPSDSRFAEYNPRRGLHLLKLSMIYSVARSNDLTITMQDFTKAKATLLEAEAMMPLALEFLGQNPMLTAIQEAHSWLHTTFLTENKKPVIERRLRHKLMMYGLNPNYIESAIQEMVNSGMMTVTIAGASKAYIPNAMKRLD